MPDAVLIRCGLPDPRTRLREGRRLCHRGALCSYGAALRPLAGRAAIQYHMQPRRVADGHPAKARGARAKAARRRLAPWLLDRTAAAAAPHLRGKDRASYRRATGGWRGAAAA